jgi:hypothetical protein
MSDSILRLIPKHPDFVPSIETANKLKRALAYLNVDADKITFKVEDHVAFVDAGENWGKIFCPVCQKELTQEWWDNAMRTAWGESFLNLRVQTVCCRSLVSINDLEYECKVGFAKFIIELRNLRQSLSNSQINYLEESAGFKFKRIDAYI